MSAKRPSLPDQACNLLAKGLLHEEASGGAQAEMFLKEKNSLDLISGRDHNGGRFDQ